MHYSAKRLLPNEMFLDVYRSSSQPLAYLKCSRAKGRALRLFLPPLSDQCIQRVIVDRLLPAHPSCSPTWVLARTFVMEEERVVVVRAENGRTLRPSTGWLPAEVIGISPNRNGLMCLLKGRAERVSIWSEWGYLNSEWFPPWPWFYNDLDISSNCNRMRLLKAD
jgi:hypothetical protein